jgi:hypothetical protein
VIRKLTSPATMLISAWDGPGKPTCDSCARFAFDHDTSGQLSLAPLSGYVDMFAAAKQVAFATPGQVIRGETGSRRHWDTGEQVITPAPAPAPAPAPVPVARAGNGFTAEERARRAGRGPAARRNTARTCWTAGLASLASIALGIVLCSESVHMQQSFMTIWGVLFIALPFLISAVLLFGWILKLASAENQKLKAWKATLTPQQRLGVELAETAALYATWAGVHHHVKESRARGAAAFQARSAAYVAGQAQQQQNQMAADLRQLASQGGQGGQPIGPGPTRRSDIYGNFS